MGLPGTGEWRRDRDSNPGRLLHLAGFQDQCIQPLCHPSGSNCLVNSDKCIHLARKTASIIYYLLKECCPVINLLSESPHCCACCFYWGLAVSCSMLAPVKEDESKGIPKTSFLIARCHPYQGVTRTKGA